MFFLGTTYVKTSTNPTGTTTLDKRLEYLIGSWKSVGFVTDVKGKQQFMEMKQRIANDNLKINELVFVGTGINPSNGFRYNSSKSFFYDNDAQAWHVKGSVQNKYTLDNKIYIPDNNTVTYTFYDDLKNLMRYTIVKENNDSFTETEEVWTANGWDKTAWFRTKRLENNTVASRSTH